MKFGILWFLHLDKVLALVKFGVIPFFIIGFVVPITSPIFVISWILFGLCAVLALTTFAIRPPSDAMMEKYIAEYQDSFEERLNKDFRNYSGVKTKTVQCFADRKHMKITHILGRKNIHGYLVLLAIVQTKEETFLIREEKALYKTERAQRMKYQIMGKNDIQISETSLCDEDNSDLLVAVQLQDFSFSVFVRNDYHYRDFIDMIVKAK